MQFFYKKTVGLTLNNIASVLDLAKQSLVDEFAETCVTFLQNEIAANNWLIAYRLAILYDLEPLRLSCEKKIATNAVDLFASKDFLLCDRDELLCILKMDMLDISEEAVFHACIWWAQAYCKRNDLDDGKPENLRAALGDALYQIRFSSMTTAKFSKLHKSNKDIFTADEAFEIYYQIGKLENGIPQKFNHNPRWRTRIELERELKRIKARAKLNSLKKSNHPGW